MALVLGVIAASIFVGSMHLVTGQGVRMKSGPYDASGQTIIDVDSGRIVSSQEQVKARVRARNEEPRKDRPDQDPWWIDAVSTARHAIIVQTEEERNAGRGASAQR